jgi:prophage DNA circulation protein
MTLPPQLLVVPSTVTRLVDDNGLASRQFQLFIANLTDNIGGASGDIAALQAEIDTLFADITTINGQIANINSQISAIQADITTINTTLTNLQNQITALTNRMTNGSCRNALLNFSGTTGTSGVVWLTIVENDLAVNHNDSQDPIAIRYWGANWVAGGTAWNYVASVLQTYFSWSTAITATRIASAQAYALANP